MDNPNHPSFGTRCPLQYSVNPSPTAWSMAGYGCGYTGGHCLPDDKCEARRESEEKRQQLRSKIRRMEY